MPITIAFTVTGIIALLTHLIYLRRVRLNRQAQREAKINGDRMRIANTFVNMETVRSIINVCFVIAGSGLLLGYRPLGYLLALPPLLSVLASALALRGIR